jgi:hypothetical protein
MESHLESDYNTDFIAAILEIEKQYGPFGRLLALSWYVYLKCNKKKD